MVRRLDRRGVAAGVQNAPVERFAVRSDIGLGPRGISGGCAAYAGATAAAKSFRQSGLKQRDKAFTLLCTETFLVECSPSHSGQIFRMRYIEQIPLRLSLCERHEDLYVLLGHLPDDI